MLTYFLLYHSTTFSSHPDGGARSERQRKGWSSVVEGLKTRSVLRSDCAEYFKLLSGFDEKYSTHVFMKYGGQSYFTT